MGESMVYHQTHGSQDELKAAASCALSLSLFLVYSVQMKPNLCFSNFNTISRALLNCCFTELFSLFFRFSLPAHVSHKGLSVWPCINVFGAFLLGPAQSLLHRLISCKFCFKKEKRGREGVKSPRPIAQHSEKRMRREEAKKEEEGEKKGLRFDK